MKLVFFEAVQNLAIVILHDLDAVSLVLIGSLIILNILLHCTDTLLHILLLVVELIFEGQEVLIQRNAIAKQSFIATSLILLVDLLLLQQLDLGFHRGDLLVQIQNDVIVDHICFSAPFSLSRHFFDFISCLLQV